ncbi:PHD finger protein 20 isoform X2 [Battus philenor]
MDTSENLNDISTSSKESESENVDAIKKFIEDQEKEIQELKCDKNDSTSKEESVEEIEKINECDEKPEPLAVATSVMDLILSESESQILSKNEDKLDKQMFSPGEKGNSMSLSVGSKVEAKDFGEFWYPAKILEVDYDEMEVLVHYENGSKKHDEWINVSSPRLRPLSNFSQSPEHLPVEPVKVEPDVVKEDVKPEEKSRLKFSVGERCLARWRDNRRFMATINKDLGNGSYEVVFDDGFQWKCTISRMYKLKETADRFDPLNFETSSSSSTSANPSPIPYGAGPSNASAGLNMSQIPAFHTHLFDPTRDYLGSKSERREKKRKLNIKEIFNIGQKKRKKQRSPKESVVSAPRVIKQRKPWSLRKKIKLGNDVETKTEIPDAVASIIGTVTKIEVDTKQEEIVSGEIVPTQVDCKVVEDIVDCSQRSDNDELSKNLNEVSVSSDSKNSVDLVLDEEAKLENFEATDDRKHEEVIDRIKEVITKLEDGINKAEKLDSPKAPLPEEQSNLKSEEPKDILGTIEVIEESILTEQPETTKTKNNEGKSKRNASKLKKSKKLRLLQEKKVKKQVEKVKSELEEMKRQVEEMKKQMLLKTEVLTSPQPNQEMPESFLLPGEWCCRWVNGQPVGTVSEIENEVKSDSNNKSPLPRRSVQVEDKRLPEGWTKHMVRRCLGNSAGKWDVVLISPDNRRFHNKTDMRSYLDNDAKENLKLYENALLDFGVHLKLARRMGWITHTGTEEPVVPLSPVLNSSSPLVRRKLGERRKLGLKRIKGVVKTKEKKRRWGAVNKIRKMRNLITEELPGTSSDTIFDSTDELSNADSAVEDGYVFVGALKVQVIENLLRCPAEGCVKNFRNNTLLKMHIKHYHRELRKMLGATPKVLDLAYARTRPTKEEIKKMKHEAVSKIIKVKIPRPPKRIEEPKIDMKELDSELKVDIPLSPTHDVDNTPKVQDSPKLRNVLVNKPVKRPKVLLPVRRPEKDLNEKIEELDPDRPVNVSTVEVLDFETAISTHTVTKPYLEIKKKFGKGFPTFRKKPTSEDDEWLTMNSDVETMSSFPGSGTPDSKTMDNKVSVNAAASSESNDDQKDSMYTYTETGERIKIVQMKREEIINCHCGYREEDGLMVQCELCLCWQHALCHNIQKESEVPEKYTCSICLNPRRGRRSKRFVHDQDRMYEGLLPGSKPCEALRRSHELSGNLLRVQDTLHALRVKYYVATKKDHPKLYLWAKDWENTELSMTQEKLNSDYSDLNIIINNMDKENMPVKTDEIKDIPMDVRTTSSEENDERFQREIPHGSQTLLSGLLSSPGGASLELPISTSELERLAKCVQEQAASVRVPQPEAAIENSACRERLLLHIQRCQALVDARLDSIEAQVAELESQDPSFEDDETADYFPRTKQTIQMLMRDLDTMEELGVIT